jgi:hypothetical protein
MRKSLGIGWPSMLNVWLVIEGLESILGIGATSVVSPSLERIGRIEGMRRVIVIMI